MEASSHLKQAAARFLPALEREMQEVVTPPSPELHELYGYLHYHLGWVDQDLQPTGGHTGKRLRPIFCLLACEACGGSWEQTLPAAAAVELLHNFSLIHDDIEDGDRMRRGRPTLWSIWSLPQALNAGDALFSLSQLALLRLTDQSVPAETVAAAMQLFNQTCLQLTQGQFLDISFEERGDVNPGMYLAMIEGKTAALMATSCKLGALVADATESRQDHLRAFGHHLGLAFQIQDDILGIWGDPQVTGKPVGADILRHKKTLPILHGLGKSDQLRPLLTRAEITPQEAAQAAQLLQEVGSRDWAESNAQEHTECALAALDASGCPDTFALQGLALELLGRVR
jgi:geranylgeranyl diphosphate synthase type I